MRLHRFELYSPYPAPGEDRQRRHGDLRVRLLRAADQGETGWPAAKIVTVPNALDVPQFDRPKLEGAMYNLGMTSMVDYAQAR